MLRNVEQRPTWDDLCDFGNVVRRLGESSDVIYLSYQGKLGVCARDLCLLRSHSKPAFEHAIVFLLGVVSPRISRAKQQQQQQRCVETG